MSVETLNSWHFQHIENAVQHVLHSKPYHERVSLALKHLVPIMHRSYDQPAESLFVDLRELMKNTSVINTIDGPNFSRVHHHYLKKWLQKLLKLYGLACYKIAAEPENIFYFEVK